MAEASIAWNRFGFGARPGEAAPAQPKRWLLDQFARYERRPAPIAALPGVDVIGREIASLAELSRDRKGADEAMQAETAEARKQLRLAQRDHYAGQVAARAQAALGSRAPFVERMVHFWSNHFAISTEKVTMTGLGGAYEFEAIRPHVLGRFRDMLQAVLHHPGMLFYLDQVQSIGPNSDLGLTRARLGLNENLAREVLELHTLGVRTGYEQSDVTELARALTGWTVIGFARGPIARITGENGLAGSFTFSEVLHEPGGRTLLGKRYPEGGEKQAAAMLDDLAVHPATARHIATKLARHFAGDEPPASLVGRLEAAFLKSSGDLPTLYRVLIEAPEAWAERPAKFKTPWEWTLSAMLALNTREVEPMPLFQLQQQLGQTVWRPGSPAGFDDVTASWAGSDALMRRVQAAEKLAQRAKPAGDVRAQAAALFPEALSATTAETIAAAESPAQGLALLLVSPEMLRR